MTHPYRELSERDWYPPEHGWQPSSPIWCAVCRNDKHYIYGTLTHPSGIGSVYVCSDCMIENHSSVLTYAEPYTGRLTFRRQTKKELCQLLLP